MQIGNVGINVRLAINAVCTIAPYNKQLPIRSIEGPKQPAGNSWDCGAYAALYVQLCIKQGQGYFSSMPQIPFRKAQVEAIRSELIQAIVF